MRLEFPRLLQLCDTFILFLGATLMHRIIPLLDLDQVGLPLLVIEMRGVVGELKLDGCHLLDPKHDRPDPALAVERLVWGLLVICREDHDRRGLFKLNVAWHLMRRDVVPVELDAVDLQEVEAFPHLLPDDLKVLAQLLSRCVEEDNHIVACVFQHRLGKVVPLETDAAVGCVKDVFTDFPFGDLARLVGFLGAAWRASGQGYSK